ncbi:MLO-like protein 15, partial [Bienertia sinuspersici]
RLKRRSKRFLYKAMQNVKQELLLLGFISLVLARLQDAIVSICIPINWAVKSLPCKFDYNFVSNTHARGSGVAHFSVRHLFAEEHTHKTHCQKQGRVSLLSYQALHDLHILIFVLAVVHVVVSALTVLFGAISQWRQWEESILEKINGLDEDSSFSILMLDHPAEENIINVKNDDFIKSRFMGIHANKRIWL